jgi:hypothetical protein
MTEMEWAYHRTNELWDEVVGQKDIPYTVWAGMFANIMGRLIQGTAEDPDDAVDIANDMLSAMSVILFIALKERFGDSIQEGNKWQQ